MCSIELISVMDLYIVAAAMLLNIEIYYVFNVCNNCKKRGPKTFISWSPSSVTYTMLCSRIQDEVEVQVRVQTCFCGHLNFFSVYRFCILSDVI